MFSIVAVEPCALEIDVAKATPSYELITKGHIGKPLAVSPSLRRKAEIDRRYATSEQEGGARMLLSLPRECDPPAERR
jgi:hypothetical protein